MKHKVKIGFTLTEVLLTLAIIGIVAALTVPSLITNIQNSQLNTAARKAFSVVSNAYLQAMNDKGGGLGAYSVGTTLTYTKFNAIKAHMNVVRECAYGSGALGKCWPSTPIGSSNSPASCSLLGKDKQDSNYSIVTADGMYWMLYTYNATQGTDILAVDVNGEKGPNDWGKDAFVFIMQDTTIIPMSGVFFCNALTHNDGTAITLQDMNPLH